MNSWLNTAATIYLALAASSCKSTDASGTKVAATTPDVARVDRMFWADGIEQVLLPAKPANLPPLAHNMAGLWYMHSKKSHPGLPGLSTGVVLLTLAGGVVQPNGDILVDPDHADMYALTLPKRNDMAENTQKFYRYKLTFADDKNGEMIWNSGTGATDGGPDDKYNWYTFTFKDGEWLRQTMMKGVIQEDYTMTQIIDELGRRTPAYEQLYLQDVGKDLKLRVTIAKDSPYGHGEPIPPPGAATMADDFADPSTNKNARDGADERPATSTTEAGKDAVVRPKATKSTR